MPGLVPRRDEQPDEEDPGEQVERGLRGPDEQRPGQGLISSLQSVMLHNNMCIRTCMCRVRASCARAAHHCLDVRHVRACLPRLALRMAVVMRCPSRRLQAA
jgi:hypothetical protein